MACSLMMDSQRALPCTELVDSIDVVEFETDCNVFRASFDSSRDSTSLAVVGVVATALGREPTDLTPLHTTVDTDALEMLGTGPSNGPGGCDRISFHYEGFVVTASEGEIEAEPIDETR